MYSSTPFTLVNQGGRILYCSHANKKRQYAISCSCNHSHCIQITLQHLSSKYSCCVCVCVCVCVFSATHRYSRTTHATVRKLICEQVPTSLHLL